MFQRQSIPRTQLFVAVDDKNHGRLEARIAPRIQGQSALAIVQLDQNGSVPGLLDGRDQGCQQG
jgi:hypothetical protein